MNLLKNIFLLSAFSFGVSNAGTVPCNGFKIDFKNKSHQSLVIDHVYFSGGAITTTDPSVLQVNNNLVYTVNQSIEGSSMAGSFVFHTTTEPTKELMLNFNLTNKNMVCEVSNFSKQGTQDTSVTRVLGGLLLHIKD